MSNVRRANEYRTQTGRCGGVVVLFNGTVSGWMNELRDPQHWEPGCIAVDHAGNEFIASGGDPYNGAAEWKPLTIDTAWSTK